MDKRQKILIVDDAEFNREILKEFLGGAQRRYSTYQRVIGTDIYIE